MVLIFSEQNTERLNYTLNLVFKTILNIDYRFTTDENEFRDTVLPKINYSNKNLREGLFLKPHPLLFQNDIVRQKIDLAEYNKQTYFFSSSEDSFLPFDIFACSFYVVSRYEEYVFTERDKHGRFPAVQSILYQLKLLERPVVNEWGQLLGEKIQEMYPQIQIPEKQFRFLMTVDVDNAWAYKNKSWGIQAGAIVKSLLKGNLSLIKDRLKVLAGKEQDPFDTYSFIEEKFLGIEDHLKFFFLLGDRRQYDKNVSYRNRNLQKLIRKQAARFETGLHPSYASNENIKLLKKEKQRLENITGEMVESSRQHYLKLNLPDTYENLIYLKIFKDFTMGYPEHVGFRAGLCTPFQFFSLKKNITTPLIVYPLHVMDGSLKNYMKLTPPQAMDKTIQLMQTIANVGGIFVCLWHNESVRNTGEWKDWQTVFLKTIEHGMKLENA